VPVLLLDSGNFSDNPTPQGQGKTKRLLQAMEKLGYEVVNVGERDIRMGYDDFRRRTEEAPFRFISANIVDKETKKPVFEPRTVVELEQEGVERKVKVGVTGVARYNPAFLKRGPDGSSMVIAHHVEAVKAQVKALENEDVDVVVVLAALPMTDAKRIAEEVPGIDYVLGAYGGMYSQEDIGPTSLIYCGNRGQRIAEARIVVGDGSEAVVDNDTVRMHFLTREYPDSKEMVRYLESLEQSEEAGGESETSQLGSGVVDARASQ
jgi:2',3'-cyclic-nucleotide 2'-phosphodiesterase (5'-nucleotidase family)